MQPQRRKDGEHFVVEQYGPEREVLEARRALWPGSYVQWESQGIPVLGPNGQPRLSGPTFVLWRPLVPRVVMPELEDPAEFVGQPAPSVGAPAAPAEESPTPEQAAQPALRRRTGPMPRQLKSVKHKNLTRVDRPARNMHGYHVRLGWKGEVYQKWFSDTTHGDRLGALTAAIAWRDAKERELGKPRSEQTVIGETGSNTGLVGVARVTMKGNEYYRALWRDADGKMRRRWFSIEQLGERRALQAAIKARQQGAAARPR